ncbi:MAG: TonB-dependent receptor [Polyangiaceae bacterium]
MKFRHRSRAGATSLSLLGAALVYPQIAFGQAPSPQAPSQPPAEQPSSPQAPSAGEEGDVEEVAVEEAPPPAPKDKGVIAGKVVESSNGEGIIEAQVTVVGTKYKTLTDLDGNYRLELPPGTYELRVFYEGHKARRVQKAAVAKGQTLTIDVSLDADTAAPEVVEIEVTPDRASAATQVLIRKNSANVGDAVSAQDIAKTPDRNAAEAARRVVGATILDGRFVYVRGLGERYTNALLNGSPLPSPEPDRQAVPLDLFPALVLSDISILKTFTPDMPGDFAGGSVSIHTRQPTDQFQIAATLSFGFNTESTFRDRLSYPGSSTDFLGIDSGRRSLPSKFPEYKLSDGSAKPDGSTVNKEDRWAAGKRINSSMQTNRSLALPNHTLNVVGGGTLSLGSAGKLGITAAATYGRRFTIATDYLTRRFNYAVDPSNPNKPFPYKAEVDNTGEIGNDQVNWGGLGVVSWSPSNDHRFTLTGLVSRSSDNEARVLTGYDGGAEATREDTRLQFRSRGLFFGELMGEHKIRALKGMDLDYRVSGSLATLDEPDTRQTSYLLITNGDGSTSRFWDGTPTLSGQHFFASQSDRSIGGMLNVTQPILEGATPLKAKAGFFVQVRERTFDARRFHFRPLNGHFNDYGVAPDQIFTDANIGTKVDFKEWTQNTDSYVASQNLYAGYLMADWTLTPALRVIGGARIESWSQTLSSFDRFLPDTKVSSTHDSVDVLPALSLVWKTTKDSNLRASVSQTVARPQLREVSPFLFTDYVGARDQQGNPDLKASTIVNADLRFEVFPGAADVLAVSAFYKQFKDPIEAIILGGSSNDLITYTNAKGARVLGLELEAKKNLGFITSALADLSPIANLTLSQSRVELDPSQGIQTTNVRPLVGQSPLVLNLGLDYTNEGTGTRARLLYNVSAARIRAAGSNNLLDTYEQPRHLLDAAIAQKIGQHVDLKLTIENILNSPYRATFGAEDKDEAVVEQRRFGTSFNLSVTVTN